MALRHQLLVLCRSSKRPRLTALDRALWAWFSHAWDGWKTRLCLVQPITVIRWQRAGFRAFWRWKSRPRKTGRKTIAPDTISLISQISRANPLWGAPRIHGELLKLGLEEVRIVPRSPWQSPYVERFIGAVRRECLDHAIALNQAHRHRLLKSYFAYYHRSRTHLGLDKDAPEPRPVRGPAEGKMVAFPQVGGLHHRYHRLAA